jgi:hypothetical protein
MENTLSDLIEKRIGLGDPFPETKIRNVLYDGRLRVQLTEAI